MEYEDLEGRLGGGHSRKINRASSGYCRWRPEQVRDEEQICDGGIELV